MNQLITSKAIIKLKFKNIETLLKNKTKPNKFCNKKSIN